LTETTITMRLSAYIYNVEQFLSRINESDLPKNASSILNLAKSYLSDAKYYFEKGDYVSSLSCIAYAEGLIDALKHLGYLKNIDWRPLSEILGRPLILVAGSFEFLHPGHIALLEKAWEMGRVHVVISRDRNFEKFKGRKPVLGEEDRLIIMKSLKYVSSVSLGDVEDFLKPIMDLKPNIVLLGPDQWIEPEELKKELENRGVRGIEVVKLEQRIGPWSSTSIYNGLRSIICTNTSRS